MAIKASAPLADEAQLETMDVMTPDPVAASRQAATVARRISPAPRRAPDGHSTRAAAVMELMGVAADPLGFNAYAGHFTV